MSVLLIDDERSFDNADVVARTFEDGVAKLQMCKWDHLLLDGDLGSGDLRRSGFFIISWLDKNPQYQPKKITIISSCPEYLGQAVEDIPPCPERLSG